MRCVSSPGHRCPRAPIYAAVLISFVSSPSTVAESAKPWFGIKTPAVRAEASARYRAFYVDPAFPPLSSRLAASEDSYGDIRGEDSHRYLTDIITATIENRPDGEKFWGRISG